MLIRYRANGDVREVRDSVGAALVARKVATLAYQTRQLTAMSEAEERVEISPRTGKPKRKYKRRDMSAED